MPIYLPELFRLGIERGLSLVYDGQVCYDFPGYCQHCGSRDCKVLGCEKNAVANLISKDGKFIPVTAYKQRHYCNRCRRTARAGRGAS